MSTDTWIESANVITGESASARMESMLDESPLIIEHRFYRGSRAPHRFVCSSHEAWLEYVSTKTSPGDSFYVWRFDTCCRDDNSIVDGKVPDDAGRIPLGGAY